MKLAKLPAILSRVFGRGHPDIYKAVKDYAEQKGQAPADVIASACAAYLSADDEGKETLEKTMAERRASGGGGANINAAVNLFNEMCKSMGTMFKTMNEARASLQSQSLIADYKAVTTAASEIKKLGGESGSGSLEDKIGEAFVTAMVERFVGRRIEKGAVKPQKKTGESSGEVKDVSSPEE